MASEPMTPEHLAEIRGREQAATSAPWTPHLKYPHICWQGDDAGEQIISANLSERPAEDIAFIAHAREDVPALLAEVERLQAKEAVDERWGAAIDWLVNSRHTGDPEIQKAFWGIVDGRCTVDEADRGALADGSSIPDKLCAPAEPSTPTEEKG